MAVRHLGAAPRIASAPGRSRVPVYRSEALSSMEAGRETGRVRRQNGRIRLKIHLACSNAEPCSAANRTEQPLAARRRNLGAVAPSHQHAILVLAQVRDADRQPYSDRGQRDGEGEGRDVRQHAMPELAGFLGGSLEPRQIPGRILGRLPVRLPLARRMRRRARPELEHAMLVIRCDGLLGFHYCRFQERQISSSTPAMRLPENVGGRFAWHGCGNRPVEPAARPPAMPDHAPAWSLISATGPSDRTRRSAASR